MEYKNKILITFFLLIVIIFTVGCSEKVVPASEDNNDEIINTDAVDNTDEKTNDCYLEDYEFEMITPDGCLNLCGDGICDMMQCLEYNCTCEETVDNCPSDC